MSTRWGLRCLDCRVDSYYWFNHGEKIVREIIRHWPHIKTIRDEDESGYLEVNVMGHGTAAFNFMDEHDGHRLILANEYGDTQPLEPPPVTERIIE